ncbi:MAG: type I-E CRISPR-associated protein Cas7/Cse4/CasC [Chloroflexi bacterium]|nr:type I-E CRISPR-associated protein Cas7/Cse4/CasC [Chloroflexota bacterium]
MFVELHMLQNFAPANLNRDDTGAPKDCEFGGYRRARISSQCLKRAIRAAFKEQGHLTEEQMAARTKRAVEAVAKRIVAAGKGDEELAKRAVEAALKSVGLGPKDDGKTAYLLFLAEEELRALTRVCLDFWDVLTQPAGDQAAGTGARGVRDAKKTAREQSSPAVASAVKQLLDGGKAVDLALFGRMIADLPERNVHAACQVAHAISTNRVSMEFDFYTAVDDLKPEDTAGADMMGTVGFNSACFYRYANVDMEQLKKNLGGQADGSEQLAREALRAFLRAAASAVPTGKQNSMAAQNPPSLIFTVVRRAGLWSLANAFVDPIRPTQDGDLVGNSAGALAAHWNKLATMYGEATIAGKWIAALDGDGLGTLAGSRTGTLEDLVTETVRAVTFAPNGRSRST